MKRRNRILLSIAALLLPLTAIAQDKELDRLIDDADRAARRHEWTQADSLYNCYITLFKQKGATKGYVYTEVLTSMVQRQLAKGNIDQAIELQNEVIEVRRTSKDCTDLQLASALSDQASIYSRKGNYNQSIALGQEAVDLYRKSVGEKHQFFNVALSNVASFFAARGEEGDQERAIRLAEKAISRLKKGTPEYATCLNALQVFYASGGAQGKAADIDKKAKKQAKKHLQENPASHAAVLNNRAIAFQREGNYPEAIKCADEAVRIIEEAQLTTSLNYSKLLTNAATFHSHVHNYDKARELLLKALPVIEQNRGKQDPDYIRCLNDLAAVHKNQGDLAKADEYANQSDINSEGLGETQNLKYAKTLSKQASIFATNGNYQRAIEHERKALAIFERRRDSLGMASTMGNIANYTFKAGRKEEGFQLMEQALDMFRRHNTASADYAQKLNDASTLYYQNQNYVKAIDYAMQAAEIYQNKRDTMNIIYAKILTNLGIYNFMSDCRPLAIDYTKRALELQNSLLGESHPDNIIVLFNLAVYLCEDKQMNEAVKYYSKAFDMQADLIKNNFLHQTSSEREHYWNQKQYIFKYSPTLAYMDQSNPQLTTDAYNSLLFMKGLLLNSDVDFRQILRRSSNDAMLEKYNRLVDLQEQKDAYYKNKGERDGDFVKKLNRDIYSLERELVRGCKEYGNFTENLNVTAEDVAKSLNDNEAAIEFANVDILGAGRTYVALLLRKDWTAPRMIRLFSDSDIEDLKFNSLPLKRALSNRLCVNEVYNSTELGKLFWQPIVKELNGVNHIFFSPAGMLYQLAVENLYCNDSTRIYDQFQLYRLSSTRSVAQRGNNAAIGKAVVYGGLDYDLSVEQIMQAHNNAKNIVNSNDLSQADYSDYEYDESELFDIDDEDFRAIDSLVTRGSVGFLEGSLHEANAIVEQLTQNSINTLPLLREEGVEETFKALSGQGFQLIHIATHGFTISETDAKSGNRELAFAVADNEGDTENSLNYSGLLLAGANYTLTNHRVPQGIDDGILTAKEIAQTDLSDAQLVVLSACQTGLGEIKDDGVFGIQRGFKKAGAKSLLMSLWSVSDKATDLMMTTFYANLMKGLSKHDAFIQAQQTVRQCEENDFSDPVFWSSFILLDALE